METSCFLTASSALWESGPSLKVYIHMHSNQPRACFFLGAKSILVVLLRLISEACSSLNIFLNLSIYHLSVHPLHPFLYQKCFSCIHLVLTATLWGRHCNYPHFPDKEAETQLSKWPEVTQLMNRGAWITLWYFLCLSLIHSFIFPKNMLLGYGKNWSRRGFSLLDIVPNLMIPPKELQLGVHTGGPEDTGHPLGGWREGCEAPAGAASGPSQNSAMTFWKQKNKALLTFKRILFTCLGWWYCPRRLII